MKLLAFDTCLDKTYITLFNGKTFLNKIIESNDKNYHSAYLISTIVEILNAENLSPSDLNYIATDIGPGSFTGIRACVTVARMLAQQLNKEVVGISSLEILSRILGENNLVALDARKNKAYLFDRDIKGAIELEIIDKIITNKKVITDNSLIERIRVHTNEAISYQEKEYPIGEILAKIAIEKIKEGKFTNWQSLKPLYIQPPPVFK